MPVKMKLPKVGEVWGRRRVGDDGAIPPLVVGWAGAWGGNAPASALEVHSERDGTGGLVAAWNDGAGWYRVELHEGQWWRAPCGVHVFECCPTGVFGDRWRLIRPGTDSPPCGCVPMFNVDSSSIVGLTSVADLIRAGWRLVDAAEGVSGPKTEWTVMSKVSELPKVGEVWGRRTGGGPSGSWPAVAPFEVGRVPASLGYHDELGGSPAAPIWGRGKLDGWYRVELHEGQRWRRQCGCRFEIAPTGVYGTRFRVVLQVGETRRACCSPMENVSDHPADLIRAGWTLFEDEVGVDHASAPDKTAWTVLEPPWAGWSSTTPQWERLRALEALALATSLVVHKLAALFDVDAAEMVELGKELEERMRVEVSKASEKGYEVHVDREQDISGGEFRVDVSIRAPTLGDRLRSAGVPELIVRCPVCGSDEVKLTTPQPNWSAACGACGTTYRCCHHQELEGAPGVRVAVLSEPSTGDPYRLVCRLREVRNAKHFARSIR